MWEKLKRWLGISAEPVVEKVTKVPTAPPGGLPTSQVPPQERDGVRPEEELPEEELPGVYTDGEEDNGSGDTLQELYDMEEPDWSELDPLNHDDNDYEGLPPAHISERNQNYQSEVPLPDNDLDDSIWDLGASDDPPPYREITGEIPYSAREVYSREDEPAARVPDRDFLEDYEREAAEEVQSVFEGSDLTESNFTLPLDDEELPPDLYAGDYFDAQDKRNLRQDPSTAEG